METNHEIEIALKQTKRCGNFSFNLFNGKKIGDSLTVKECMSLYNTYGMSARYVIFMADSHGMLVDEIEFERLILQQKEEMKNCKSL